MLTKLKMIPRHDEARHYTYTDQLAELAQRNSVAQARESVLIHTHQSVFDEIQPLIFHGLFSQIGSSLREARDVD